MKKQDTCKNKIQNLFTAYALRSVEGKQLKYLAKKSRKEVYENFLEDVPTQEAYLNFDTLYDDSLIRTVRLLQPEVHRGWDF